MILSGKVENIKTEVSIVEYKPRYMNLSGSFTLHRTYSLKKFNIPNLPVIKYLNPITINNGGVL